MKNKKLQIIDKSDIMACWKCNGEKFIVIDKKHPLIRKQCSLCKGTGKFRESHYIIVDKKNKIAIDSDFVS